MEFFMGLNYWAILVSAIACMVIGMIWYMPAVFGSIWMRATGITKERIEHERKKGMAGAYIGMFIGALILSIVFAHFIGWLGITDWAQGLLLGVVAWLGFVATAFLGGTLFEKRPWAWFWVSVGYYLVQMAVIGAILGGWR